MTIRHRLRLGTSLIVTASVSATVGTLAAERSGLISLAQAQQQTEEQKKKERRGQPPPPPPKAAPAPPPRAMPAPKAAPQPSQAPPPSPPPKAQPGPFFPKAAAPPPPPPPAERRQGGPPPPPVERRQGGPPPPPVERRQGGPAPVFKTPDGGKSGFPSKGETFPKGEPKGEDPRGRAGTREPRGPLGQPAPDKGGPRPGGVAPPPAATLPPAAAPKGPTGPPGAPAMGGPSPQALPRAPAAPGASPEGPSGRSLQPADPGAAQLRRGLPGPKRFEEVQKARRERVEDGGKDGRKYRVLEEPDRTIIKYDNRVIIRHDEAERFRRRPDARTERRSDGVQVTFFDRPGGVRVVTEVDTHGRLLRRYRRGPDGREVHLIDNRRYYRNLGLGVAVGVGVGIVALNLARPRIVIPREKYILEYDYARDSDLDEVLLAPPIDRLDRAYSLEEIRYNHELREYTRRIDLDINFEFGSWEITPEQYPKLERLARAMLRALERDAELVFLIEGHTDAVGSDDDNLSLSDRRAASVAEILSDEFGVPPENLVTQGYGEQHLKVDSQGPERLNRRVAVRNVKGLMAER
jgi:outer membrane protein OmpA-like peptidoglycan-associated protein